MGCSASVVAVAPSVTLVAPATPAHSKKPAVVVSAASPPKEFGYSQEFVHNPNAAVYADPVYAAFYARASLFQTKLQELLLVTPRTLNSYRPPSRNLHSNICNRGMLFVGL
jgi:hypothetical protein